MSRPWRALTAGIRVAAGSPRMLGLLLLANLVLAAVALSPVFTALNHLLAPIGDGYDLLHHWPAWLDIDFRAHAAPALGIFSSQVALIIFIHTLLSAFLTAGTLGVLHDSDGAFSIAAFMRGSGRYGPAFIRLLFIFLGCSWMMLWLAGSQLGALREYLLFDWPSARGATLLTAAHQVLLVALFYLLAWVAEISRVVLVVEKRRSALAAFISGLGILSRHLPALMTLLLSLALIQFVLLAAAGRVIPEVFGSTWTMLLIAFLGVQVTVALRLALRIAGLEALRRWLCDDQ